VLIRANCSRFVRSRLVLSGLILVGLSCRGFARSRLVLSGLVLSGLVLSGLVLGRIVLGRLVRCSRLFRRYAGAKRSRLRSSRDCRFTVVHRILLLWVSAGSSHLLGLSGYRGNMFLMRRSLLLSGWTRGDPASAPV